MSNIENIKGKNPFRVPDNYFEEVNRKILAETAGLENEIEKPGRIRSLRPYFLVAASVAGFLLISYGVAKYVFSGKVKNNPDSLYAITIQDQYFNDIDLYTLEEQTISEGWTDGIRDIKKSDIVDYLMYENIEINEIYEDL